MKRWISIAIWVAATAASASVKAEFVGEVIGVVDGDTLDVLVERQPIRIRLAEIDAPEKRQPFGARSRQALSDMVFGRTVTVVDQGLDWRGARTIGRILINGKDVNRAMVASGWAWVYPKYDKDRSLFDIEREARVAHRGLWADPDPIPPWAWRSAQRGAK